MATSHCPHCGQSPRGTVLPCATHVEEARREPTQVGVQPVPSPCTVEVRPLFEELLLLEAVPECQLAYRAQARVLQAREVLVERGGLHCWHLGCGAWYFGGEFLFVHVAFCQEVLFLHISHTLAFSWTLEFPGL